MNLFKERDKRKHFGLGLLLSWVAGWLAFVLFADFVLIASILVPFIASLIWEWIHLKRSKFSWDDVFAAMCGAIIATVSWVVILLLNTDWVGIFN